MKSEMPASAAAALYRKLTKNGVRVWIDGGWGVDALLGEQTRPHGDLDLVVRSRDLTRLVGILSDAGYRPVARDDTRSWNFVLGDDRGREVDLHVIDFDGDGNGIYGPAENGEAYPAHAFAGVGRIDGQEVACMSVAYQRTNHAGYALREKDRHDLSRLRERFGDDAA